MGAAAPSGNAHPRMAPRVYRASQLGEDDYRRVRPAGYDQPGSRGEESQGVDTRQPARLAGGSQYLLRRTECHQRRDDTADYVERGGSVAGDVRAVALPLREDFTGVAHAVECGTLYLWGVCGAVCVRTGHLYHGGTGYSEPDRCDCAQCNHDVRVCRRLAPQWV